MSYNKDIYNQVQENWNRIDSCRGHTFPSVKHKLGQKHTCTGCHGVVDAPYLMAYIKGWQDAGKDPNYVFPGWRT